MLPVTVGWAGSAVTPDERPPRVPPFYSDDAVTIWHGNALELPLDDESVDLVVTSPPYFGLRAYADGGETYSGQIGSEATPGEFLDALAAATREMARVLKPGGSIFVNLGDKYSGYNNGSGKGRSLAGERGEARTPVDNTRDPAAYGVPAKSLMLLPERYRIRCVDDLGLIARAVIVWDKPNGLPESVRDRVRRSHEDWVHLTREPRYFTGIDEIREPHGPATTGRDPHGAAGEHYKLGNDGMTSNGKGSHPTGVDGHLGFNPLGKLPGSVWTIPTQPLRVPPELGIDHFAAFPMEWPRRIIRGWSPTGICVECGKGRRPVARTDVSARYGPGLAASYSERALAAGAIQTSTLGPAERSTTITGYACACDAPTAPTRPAVILDPFGGTGTTGVVAKALGRRAHLVDLSADYCRLAQWRVNDPVQLAKAAQVKPLAKRKAKVTKLRPAQPEQESLLGDEPAA